MKPEEARHQEVSRQMVTNTNLLLAIFILVCLNVMQSFQAGASLNLHNKSYLRGSTETHSGQFFPLSSKHYAFEYSRDKSRGVVGLCSWATSKYPHKCTVVDLRDFIDISAERQLRISNIVSEINDELVIFASTIFHDYYFRFVLEQHRWTFDSVLEDDSFIYSDWLIM